MICKNCGKELQDASVFCPGCGFGQSSGINNTSDWLSVWRKDYRRAVDKFENGKEGGSTKVIGRSVSITYDYYTGITAGTKSLFEALGSVFLTISNMDTNSEIIEAALTVNRDANELATEIWKKIEKEYIRMRNEIEVFCSNVESASKREMTNSNVKMRKALLEHLDVVTKYVKDEMVTIQKGCCKRYWEEHKDEKQELDAEKEALKNQIEQLNEQIEQTTKNTEGYGVMITCENKVKQLLAEKSKLGLFSFKEKKEIKAQIKQLNNSINIVKERIKLAVEKIEPLKTPLNKKINEIDQRINTPIVLL